MNVGSHRNFGFAGPHLPCKAQQTSDLIGFFLKNFVVGTFGPNWSHAIRTRLAGAARKDPIEVDVIAALAMPIG
jgi:hypothetical protein